MPTPNCVVTFIHANHNFSMCYVYVFNFKNPESFSSCIGIWCLRALLYVYVLVLVQTLSISWPELCGRIKLYMVPFSHLLSVWMFNLWHFRVDLLYQIQRHSCYPLPSLHFSLCFVYNSCVLVCILVIVEDKLHHKKMMGALVHPSLDSRVFI